MIFKHKIMTDHHRQFGVEQLNSANQKRGSFSVKLQQFILPLAIAVSLQSVPGSADPIGPLDPAERAQQAFEKRFHEAVNNLQLPLLPHPHNDDEARYPGKINSYTKGLPHDENGIVTATAYDELIHALSTGDPMDFDAITMGEGGFLLRNPQAAYNYFMEGRDSNSFTMQPAPAFSSAHQAAEAIEVMWQALTRDVPYSEYESSELIRTAARDLSRFSDFPAPKVRNRVTPGTLFRGVGVGELNGPYISQFLLKSIPYGATTVEQLYKVPVTGNDHLMDYDEWLHIQRGGRPTGATTVEFDSTPRYIYNGRAMAQYVLRDFVNQAYLGAARILSQYGSGVYDVNEPYNGRNAEARSPLFGINHAIDWLSRVSMGSQSVAWYQKWLVHRRARPEVFFGRVHNHLTNPNIEYPIHRELFRSRALDMVFAQNGTYLLPTATPNGSPLHPTYPAGHSVMAGAAVTVMKAFFNGDFIIPDPVQTSADGTELLPYDGELTVEGELNKLASNISLGRDIAGVHYRTDGDWGMALGERYAISLLRELVNTYNEDFAGFSFNRFDGTPMFIAKQ